MKTKMLFAIAALLMMGSVCLKAQENSNGSTSIDYSKQYFTIVANDSPITVTWEAYYDGAHDSFELNWSYDGGDTWEYSGFPMDYYSVTIKAGEKCYFISEALGKEPGDVVGSPSINVSGGSYTVEGNILSLVHGKQYLNPSRLLNINCSGQEEMNGTIGGFFGGNTYLTSAENLILPTSVNTNCYKNMFKGCTSLTKAPELPATTLAKGCYASMFSGCTSLNYIKCLATDISATDCTDGWLDGVSLSGTFVKAASMNDWASGTSGIPSGWTVINDGATPIDYSKQPFTIVPLENDMSVGFLGIYDGETEHFEISWSYDGGKTWNYPKNIDHWEYYSVEVKLGQKLSLRLSPVWGDYNAVGKWSASGGKFNVEGNLSTIKQITTYAGFFSGKTNLVSAENLIIPESASCENMFSGCTNLTKAPVLSASTLSENQYKNMFNGCTSLNYIKCLATDISATDCTDGWLDGVSLSGTFVKAASMNNWSTGASGIPSGWTVSNDGTTPSTPTDYSAQYLTFVAIEDGTFSFSGSSSSTIDNSSIQYSLDSGSTWNTLDRGVQSPTVSAGNIIMWKGNFNAIIYNGIGYFSSTGRFDVEGNVMSLLYGDNFQNQTDLTEFINSPFGNLFRQNENVVNAEKLILPATALVTYSYYLMFYNCTSLTKAPTLPATTLANSCYYGMFRGCTSLTAAPVLPATTLEKSCYESMFQDCTSLTTMPTLSATTLAYRCYSYMFEGCTSLTAAPVLPATTLANNCYYGMFRGCTSLTKAPALPSTTLAEHCYQQMFAECTSLTTTPNNYLPATTLAESCYCDMFDRCTSLTAGPELPAITLANMCYYGMFKGCTSLTKAPTLPATTLANMCYQNMFSGCTNLKYIECFATDISATDCTRNWLSSVSSSGTFVKNASMNSWSSGIYGIPNGWTITNAQTNQTKRTIHVATAGTLPDLISEDEKYQIEELTLTGELNGTDIHFIRDMAGVNMDKMGTEYCPGINDEWAKTKGKLRVLDLSCVTIVEGGRDYYKMMTSSSKDLFDYYQYTKENSISTCMFADCWKLEQLILPRSVTSISDPLCDIYAAIPITINIKILKVADGNSYYDSRNNCNAIIETKTNTMIAGCLTTKIPESVTSIGDNAFLNLKNLSSVTIPNSVTSIGQSAFSGCSGLTSVTIPNSVTSISQNAFYKCSGLTKVVSKIKKPFTIDASVFPSDIYSNAELVVPAGTKSLYEAANGWKSFSKITESPAEKRTIHVATAGTLPNLISEDEKYQIEELTLTGELNGTDFKFIREMAGDIVSYGRVSLWGNVYHNPTDGILTSLDISNAKIVNGGENYNYYISYYDVVGLSTIDDKITAGLFSQTNLKSIILPNTVTTIDEGISYTYMVSTGGTLGFDGEKSETGYIYVFPTCLNSITIPSSITSIGYGALSNTAWYNNQPDGLVYAGKVAYKFKGEMPANTNIIIKDGTLGIAGGAFEGCSSLTSVTIPNSVTSIGSYTFSRSGLTSINIPNSVTSIGDRAFESCSGLTSVTIPNSVTSIGERAFEDCSGLTSITIPNSVTSIGKFAFSGCSGLTSITISNSVTSIAVMAFYGCNSLTAITIPNNVTSIGSHAFSNCSGLTSVAIPNSVTSISWNAFDGTAWFNNQPDGLVYAGKVAYKYKGEMPANTNIIIEDGTLGIAVGAFKGCSGLTSVTFPNSVTSIDQEAFEGCSGLTSVTIPNSVTSIEYATFSGCSGLTSITIPNSVTFISNYAFYGCSGLTKVISKIKNPFTIDSSVFPSDIYTNAELIVPAGTKSLYEATGGWNKFSKITEHLPTLETQPAQPTSTTKARLIALANEEDDDQHYGFEWLRYDAPQEMPANKVSAPLYDGRIIGSLGGLNPDIYYKYRPFYKSDSGEMAYGEWIPFLTGDANVFFEPEVHTKDAIVSNDGALLSAVFVEGTEDIQEKGFEYWPKNSNARAVSLTRGDNIGSVIVSGNNTSVTIEGLKAGTEYGYRPYVKTASGITYGEEKTFKTSMYGDVNGDNKVDNNDLNDLVSYIMGIIPPHFNKDAADLNNDKKVNAADIVKMVNILK